MNTGIEPLRAEAVLELLLVRHALPIRVLDAPGPADPGLSVDGHEQVAKLANYLSTAHLDPESAATIDEVISSPLRRALETAGPIAAALALPVTVDEDLAEVDRLSNSYVPMEELRRDPALAAAVRRAGATTARETAQEFRTRVVATMEQLIVSSPGRRLLIVSHAGVINAYFAHVLGLDRDLFFEPRYTSISRLLASRRGHRNIETLNETHHLSWAASRVGAPSR